MWYIESEERFEHDWAGILAGIEGVEEVVPGFGSSDCGCSSHLFRTDSAGIFDVFVRLAGGEVTRSAAVRENG